MNPTNAVVLTGLTVVLGKWSADQAIDVRLVVGITGAALGLAVINEASEDLASKIGLLLLLGAVFIYLPSVAKKAGLMDVRKPARGTGMGPGSSFKGGRAGGGGGGGGGGSW